MKRGKLLFIVGLAFILGSCGNDFVAPEVDNTSGNSKEEEQKNAPAGITATQDPYFAILNDAFGYNTRFPDVVEPWSSNDYLYANAFVNTYANNLRYPGGTVANYWDAYNQKLFVRKHSSSPDRGSGWVDAANLNSSSFVYDIIRNDLQQKNSLEDLASVVSRSGASVVFVLNMITPGRDFYASAEGWNRPVDDHPGTSDLSDDWYKMLDDRFLRMKKMLGDARNNNIPVEYVQLGNELYWGGDAIYNQQAFPDGIAYAKACNYIVNKLKSDPDLNLPASVKYVIVGAGESVAPGATRVLGWNEQVFGTIDESLFEYATIHNYGEVPQIENFDNINVKQNVTDWIKSLDDSFVTTNAYQYIINPGHWRVFYTEIRANPKQPSKWGRCLIEVYSGIHMLGKAGVLYMQPNFDAVVKGTDGDLKSRAYAFMPLMRASKGATQAAEIHFPGTGKLPGSTEDVVQGFAFKTPEGHRSCVIISFSENNFNMDLTSVFGSKTVNISGHRNAVDVNGQPIAVDLHSANAADVLVQPYVILYVRE